MFLFAQKLYLPMQRLKKGAGVGDRPQVLWRRGKSVGRSLLAGTPPPQLQARPSYSSARMCSLK